MCACGRIRKPIRYGWTQITEGELLYLEMGVIKLEPEASHLLYTRDREHAAILIAGECYVQLDGGQGGLLGPRRNPFDDLPYAVFVTRDEQIIFTAKTESLIAIGSSPASKKLSNAFITPQDVQVLTRGADNWRREVRNVCWSDNTEGNMLLVGETCTPSGNWSTIPPHRHQYDVEGVEASYDEIYFFQFSHPYGYGLIRQFDDDGEMDQAFSLRSGDVVYHNEGYHPVVCSPGTKLYHLTFMAGPRRESRARVHEKYQYILEESGLQNQFTPY